MESGPREEPIIRSVLEAHVDTNQTEANQPKKRRDEPRNPLTSGPSATARDEQRRPRRRWPLPFPATAASSPSSSSPSCRRASVPRLHIKPGRCPAALGSARFLRDPIGRMLCWPLSLVAGDSRSGEGYRIAGRIKIEGKWSSSYSNSSRCVYGMLLGL
jgi:hypothetical protein